jgi:hypothetical protein
MSHGLDVTRLDEIFESLEENSHKLTAWENDRVPEWKALHEAGKTLSEKQLECLERMYVKV